uniref:Allatotropin neuropeptide n=1 Tax=Platynereis dumerilii TaxID=6359 RepID=V5TCS2_PLADU|nr:allatotropin neuropeptide precursor [Platynereis dumerilii]
MKVVLCLFVVVFVVSVNGMDLRAPRAKRGFRTGAYDRFSHGFGKRGELTNEDDGLMSVEDMAELITNTPKLALSFVKRYMDRNDDGVISKEELLFVPEQ